MQLLQSIEELNRIWYVEYSHKLNQVYTSSTTPYVKVYDFSDSQLIEQRQLLTPHTRLLACCSFDSTISLWDISTNTPLGKLEGHESEVKCIDWNQSSTVIASCSRDKSVWLWKTYSGIDYECLNVLTGHTGDVKCVFGSFDGTIRVWKGEDESEWNEQQTVNVHNKTVWDLKNTSDGKFLVSSGANGVLCLFEFDDGLKEVDCIINESYRDIYSIDIIGTHVLVGSGDNAIRIYNINSNTKKLELVQEQLNAHDNDVNAVCWINRTTFVSVGDDNF
ncbi:Protein CIAO1 [Entamoeba marina]